MGIDARIVVYAKDQTTAENACSAAFKRIAELDTIMSDYRVDSELNNLCAKPFGKPVSVSRDLFVVLRRAEEVSRRSEGAFDVTVGPLIKIWRKARKTGVLPLAPEVEAARQLVGWQNVVLDSRARTVTFKIPGIKLDLGGIAKGYADDQAQIVLKKCGIDRALIEMGGDIVVTGPPPGTKGWKIQVPNAGADMLFSHCAISTSGDTEQFTVIGGVQYSHVVDPRTGWALTNRVQSTIIARDGLTTDPLSTALTVLGDEDRARFLKWYPKTKSFMKSLKGK